MTKSRGPGTEPYGGERSSGAEDLCLQLRLY